MGDLTPSLWLNNLYLKAEVSVGELTPSLWLKNLYLKADFSVGNLIPSLWLKNLHLKAEAVQLVSRAPKHPAIARALSVQKSLCHRKEGLFVRSCVLR